MDWTGLDWTRLLSAGQKITENISLSGKIFVVGIQRTNRFVSSRNFKVMKNLNICDYMKENVQTYKPFQVELLTHSSNCNQYISVHD